MLTNRNIICVGTPPWESDYASTTVELMKRFGDYNKILYVNGGFTIKDLVVAILKGNKRALKQAFGIKGRIRTVSKNVHGEINLLTLPPQLSINFLPEGIIYNLCLNFNGRLARNCIRKYLAKLQMKENLVHINSFNPSLGVSLAGHLGENVIVYHCYDEISGAPWMQKHGPSLENAFVKKANGVIVTSQGLLEEKRKMTSQCFLVKNAADIELFSAAFNTDIPQQKVIGFIGSLDDRIDYELLHFVIEELPELQFEFIGRITEKDKFKELTKLPNVTYHPPKALKELPAFLKTFSAGIIPFVKSKFTKGIYPLKINEYLAAGLPVVTTNFSYLDEFRNVVEITEDKEGFKNALLKVVMLDSLDLRKRRQLHAKKNSWDVRIEEFSAAVIQMERKKQTLATKNKLVYE